MCVVCYYIDINVNVLMLNVNVCVYVRLNSNVCVNVTDVGLNTSLWMRYVEC